MMIDSLSLLWVRHVAFVHLKLSSKAHGGGLSCQSQDNLSVQKQILKSVHFLVGAPAPSSPPYATKTQYENVLPYSIVSECAQYMYRVSTRPHVFTPQLHSPDSLLSQPPEKQDIFLSIKDLCLLFWRSGVHGLLGPHIKTEGDWEAHEAEESSTEF